MRYPIFLFLFLVLTLLGCDRAEPSGSQGQVDAESASTLKVVATTTMLADLLRHLGGDHVEVHSLVGFGADPHVYQPRPSDARRVSESGLVAINGLLLEGWMESLVRHAGGERPILVAGDAIEEAELLMVEGAVDPHIWFDTRLWIAVANHMHEGLLEVLPAELHPELRERYDEYRSVLEALDGWTRAQILTIPESRRVLITSHDAFNYFGRAYSIDVEGVVGLSTEQEASQRDLANIIELVRERQAPAVFTETSVNSALIRQVAQETGARAVGPLYSDSLGPPDSNAHTYVGMVESNVKMIVEALGGEYEQFLGARELQVHGEVHGEAGAN